MGKKLSFPRFTDETAVSVTLFYVGNLWECIIHYKVDPAFCELGTSTTAVAGLNYYRVD